ncbi:MAG: elongator complex protein 3 [Acidobacteriota bacterium]
MGDFFLQEGIQNKCPRGASLRFAHPAPSKARPRILPVFLPLAGCPGRCLFCAQHAQTGMKETSLEKAHDFLERSLETARPDAPLEVGFYGGTFTALPPAWMERFLATARQHRERGAVCGVRCSTRPDRAPAGLLRELAEQGLDRVELGVQTFCERALRLAERGHGAEASLSACRAVHEAGLGLSLHLLPGLPGHTPEDFRRDVEQAAALEPEAVRLHPCLVLAGTGLEQLWRAGGYEPWSLERTIAALAPAVLRLWRAGVAVTRIGLAHEPDLEAAVLAGPTHPALGMRVRATALHIFIAELLGGRLAERLLAPASASGGFWGHARELAEPYAVLGLERGRVHFEDRDEFQLDVRND